MKISEIITESNDSYMMAVEEGDEYLDESLPLLPYKLILTNCDAWYEGVISKNDIEKSVANLKMEPSKYYQYTREALFSSTDASKCIFDVEKMDLVKKAKFVWKRLVEPSSIKYQLGSVTLRIGKPEEVLKKLLVTVMMQLDKDCTRIAQLEKERDRLAFDRDEALSTLATCVEAKQTMEKELFGKFVAVLNEKKSFLQSNQNGDSMLASNESRPFRSPSPLPVASTSGTKKKMALRQHDDDDDDLLFDDFGDEDTQPIRRNPNTVKSSQKRKGAVVSDDNLVAKPKIATKTSAVPKMTRRSTGSDSDPSKLLDIL